MGRFQPFHREHLEYALAAKARCRFLWVGLSNCLKSGGGEGHRLLEESNPLSFGQRYQLVSAALIEAGCRPGEFGILPCPVELPELLGQFVDPETRVFLTVNEAWGEEKVGLFETLGYEVEVLWRREKGISGTEIRKMMADGDERASAFLSPEVRRLLEEWKLLK